MSQDMPLAHLLARFAVTQRAGVTGLPGVEDIVRSHIIDLLGNSVAAAVSDIAGTTGTVIRSWGGAEDATAIGLSGSYPSSSVALHNGTLAHALDFDDTHLPSVVHPSASVIPSVLAVGEKLGMTFEEVIPAIAVGLEVTCRLGMAGYDAASNDSVFFDRGLHATSICGALGAGVAVTMLLGGSESEIGHAIGIAASMGAGLLEANRTGGTVKKMHCGWAAHSGVVAGELSMAGLTGPPTVLEGRFGFLQAHCGDRANVDALSDALGSEWALEQIGFKPYPCNIYTHPIIDAALQLRMEGVRGEDLERVEIGASGPTLRTIAEPPERKARPATGYEAQFSGPYAFAAALLGGGGLGVYLEDFTDDAVRDPARLDLASRVTLREDESCSKAFPERISAVVDFFKKDGTQGQIRIPKSRGFGEYRLNNAEQKTKFSLNASQAMAPEGVGALVAIFPRLPQLHISQVLQLTQQVAAVVSSETIPTHATGGI